MIARTPRPAPAAPAAPAAMDLDALARLGEALSDDTRRRILVALADGPRYPSDLASDLGAGRSSVSNHLTCLRGCGLVIATPEGRRMRYELVSPRLAHALNDLVGVVLAVDPAHAHLEAR